MKNCKCYKKIITVASVVLAFVVMIGVCGIYLGDYYRADIQAVSVFMPDNSTYKFDSDGNVVFETENATTGLIFYPGGKVEHAAYIPLMQSFAEKGILCILVEMPFNLAVFDINAAEGIQARYPQIENWYIGGHSLGGSMAASYLSEHEDEYNGLILLGSYSTSDLSDSGLQVLSVYGSEDMVMNREKYEECKSNLPDDFTEIVIDGGCHAYFGMYGTQDGDGVPTVSNEDQIHIVADNFALMIQER